MRQTLLAIPAVLAACTDAAEPTADLSCQSELAIKALPSSMTGRVLDENGGAPIVNAAVMLESGIESPIAGTDETGRYQLALDKAVVASERHAIAAYYLDGYLFSDPASDEVLPMLTAVAADRLYAVAGVTRDPYKATLLIGALDCNGLPIEGADIRAAGASGTLYLGADTQFDRELTATTIAGTALVLNVPPGEVALEVEIDGVALSSSPTIVAHANALSTGWRRP